MGEGTATITLTVGNDATYALNSTTVTVKVSKIATEINLNSNIIDLKANYNVNLNATLNPADAGDLTFVSSNESVVRVFGDGWLVAWGKGTATVTVSFAGNDKYAAAESKTVTVNVALRDSSVSVENSTLDLKVGDTFDLNATSVPDFLNIQYVSSNESVVSVNSYGIVTAVGEGNATITLTVGNGETYGVNFTTVTVKVSEIHKIPTQITSSPITTVYNVNKNLIVTLKDANGNSLKGVNLTVDLKGAKTYVTDSNGLIKVSTKGLAPNVYTVKVTFNGNTQYIKSTHDVKVTVKKATPKMAAKKKTFKKAVKTKKYTITLKDNTGKAMKSVKVSLKIKGKKVINVKTNAKGKATFKIKKLTKKGTYKATVTYKGNAYYNKVVKKVKIRVK